MSRMARIVVEGCPHHVIQKGNRNQQVFFNNKDKNTYLKILREEFVRHEVNCWSYCLMDNHVHLIAIPKTREGLSRAFGEAHRRYTTIINKRNGWKGYLWQGRYRSIPMSKPHVYAAVRYIERNPVDAGIVKSAEDYPWSSAKSRIFNLNHPLLSNFYLCSEVDNWSNYLKTRGNQKQNELIEKHLSTGRPLGDEETIKRWGKILGRKLMKSKPGPKVSLE